MVKMTYIPNRIGIPTYGGDLGHHMLCLEQKTQESPMEPPQPKRGGGRKRKKGRGHFMRTSHARSFGVTELHHSIWRDLCTSRTHCSDMTELTWHGGCQRGGHSRHCTWRDSFISHAKRPDATQNDQIYKKIVWVHFSKIL
jgi:hypothetical protein